MLVKKTELGICCPGGICRCAGIWVYCNIQGRMESQRRFFGRQYRPRSYFDIGWCDFLQRTDKYKTNLRNHAVSGRPAAAQYINVHALQKGVHVPPCCIFGLNSMSTARCSSCIRKQIS